MKEIILFDLDGTLTDPKVGITQSVQYALRHFDINVENPDELCKFIGPPLRVSLKEFFKFNDEDAEKAVEKYRERFLEKGIYENVMYEGIDTLLENLKNHGKTLMVATSKPTVMAKQILEYFNLDKYFTFISGAELCGKRSEKSEVIQYALNENDISDLDSCIMVGDRKYDILGAKAVGIANIGVLYGYGDKKELSEAGADFIVPSVTELQNRLFNGRQV
ncbi:MAG: HAD family hydrolase [Defluviitaleaceae bacterium]|nr:HAD family hydrolase [Defluviitaleaceae bacterium]